MPNKYFNFGEVLGYGWRTMKANLWFFVGVGILWLLITYIPTAIGTIAAYLNLPEPAFAAVRIITAVLGWIISAILSIGMIKIALSFCDERKPTIAMLFDARDCFWRYAAVAILYGLIILGVVAAFTLPGILFATIGFPWFLFLMIPAGVIFVIRLGIQFGLCFYFVIDKGLGPFQALKASSATTMAVKWELLGFHILCDLINLLGLLCLIVGIFATYPMVIVASALVYRQLATQTPELAEFGIAAPTVEPDTGQLPQE